MLKEERDKLFAFMTENSRPITQSKELFLRRMTKTSQDAARLLRAEQPVRKPKTSPKSPQSPQSAEVHKWEPKILHSGQKNTNKQDMVTQTEKPISD
jgi:hypothetical protein